MKKGSLNFFELHVEKVILGAAGLFTLAFLWLYLINSPNRVEYKGEPVGPGELDEKVLEDARGLKQAVDRATPTELQKPEYKDRLREQHLAGIFGRPAAGDGPVLAAALPAATAFGTPITIPGQKEIQASDIVVVKPLRPATPVARTGRSMAIRREVDLAAAPVTAEQPGASPRGGMTPTAEPAPGPEAEAVETPWVTVAAWFDTQAQQNEMTNARYEPYLSRVLFAGVDVERQEQQADGAWTEWAPVTASKAMPKFEVPEPIFDSTDGSMVNKAELDTRYEIAVARQKDVVEPEFYDVTAGDHWLEPPLPGLALDELSDDEAEPPTPPRAVAEREPPAPPAGRQPSPPGGGSRVFNPGGGGRVAGGGPRGGGGFQPTPAAGGGAARQARENREAADRALRDARKALRSKDYETARARANEAANNSDAKPKTAADARKLLAEIEKKLAAGSPIGVDPRLAGLAGVGARMASGGGASPGAAPEAAASGTLVTHPEREHEVALWFHDDSVESGKTYRYRLRAKLWNRYVGMLRAVKDINDAKTAVLVGEWSLPTSPITVAPSTHLFVKSGRSNKQAASIEVWKWRSGEWISESFDVAVGDTIGGVKRVKTGEVDENDREIREDVDFTTGAVVLDLRFDERVKVRAAAGKQGEYTYREVTSLVLVYLDPADGQVKERVQALDRDDRIRKRLVRESGGDA